MVAGAGMILATAWLLMALAQFRVAHWLSDSAAHALALSATGETPYRWRIDRPRAIVAGRVFGSSDDWFSDDSLVVRSNGKPFEIGMPLPHAVDLRRFARLRMDTDSDVPIEVGVVVRSRLDLPQSSSAMTTVPSGRRNTEITLSSMRWSASAQAPNRAAMLRLRVQLPHGQRFHLYAVALERIDGFQRLALAKAPQIVDANMQTHDGSIAVYRISQHADAATLQAIGNRVDVHSAILTLLPQASRVEQQLLLRDRLLDAVPAAIAIPQDAVAATFALARAQSDSAPSISSHWPWRWIALGAYTALLVAARFRPPSRVRVRAALEVILALLGPIWLIAGDQFTGTGDAWQQVLIGVSVVYAISLFRPHAWHWNGSAKAWLLAAAVVIAAASLGIVMHRPGTVLRTIDAAHIVRYLAWAGLQQYLVCAICTERWRMATNNSAIAVYLGALGFALMHTPNATLMLATFCGGLCWCALYLRERALLPLAASHATSALLLVALLPPDILRSAEVSARFFS